MLGELLPVNEVFQTMQGEGRYSGTPAIFIRLQGCPVGCPWCDTPYTWAKDANKKVSFAQILQKTDATDETYANVFVPDLVACLPKTPQHVVITGGEPAQYDLRELTEGLIRKRHTTQVETSGTFDLQVDTRTWVTVSPKLDMPGGLDVKPSVLKRANEIKHVVGKKSDVETLKSLLPSANPMALVYVQPLSGSPKATNLCIEEAGCNGWKVSIQTHRLLKGVR